MKSLAYGVCKKRKKEKKKIKTFKKAEIEKDKVIVVLREQDEF
jgi:hypothetical protein